MAVGGKRRLGKEYELWWLVALCAIFAQNQYPIFGSRRGAGATLLTNPWLLTLMAFFLAWASAPLNAVATLPSELSTVFERARDALVL